MTRVRDTPVLGSTPVRDVRAASGGAGAQAAPGTLRTAAVVPAATEPATHPLKHAGGRAPSAGRP